MPVYHFSKLLTMVWVDVVRCLSWTRVGEPRININIVVSWQHSRLAVQPELVLAQDLTQRVVRVPFGTDLWSLEVFLINVQPVVVVNTEFTAGKVGLFEDSSCLPDFTNKNVAN